MPKRLSENEINIIFKIFEKNIDISLKFLKTSFMIISIKINSTETEVSAMSSGSIDIGGIEGEILPDTQILYSLGSFSGRPTR